GMIWHNNAYIF
nr:immunoglobulin light chain junction region [Macaca mulatta]MPO07677.1 immunoglobulin light chain junction region [Macaca mulatta]